MLAQYSTTRTKPTHLEDIQHCDFSVRIQVNRNFEDGDAHALLKQPPSAPASAAANGVSCIGFIGLDWVDMTDDEDQEGRFAEND